MCIRDRSEQSGGGSSESFSEVLQFKADGATGFAHISFLKCSYDKKILIRTHNTHPMNAWLRLTFICTSQLQQLLFHVSYSLVNMSSYKLHIQLSWTWKTDLQSAQDCVFNELFDERPIFRVFKTVQKFFARFTVQSKISTISCHFLKMSTNSCQMSNILPGSNIQESSILWNVNGTVL